MPDTFISGCLDSTLATFATGDTPSTNVDGVSYPATNVLKVLGTVQRYTDYGNLTRDKGTYWPPRGWIPTPVVPNYWSIIKDGWTFADAVVTMYKNGAVVPVTTRHDSSWEAKQLIWTKPNVSPLEGDYTVVIQNGTKDGVPRQTLAYYVHVFNPDTPFTTRTTITSTRSVTRTSSTSKTMSTITQPANMVKFTGTVIGTLGTYGGGLDRTKCYDGDTSTAFDAASSNGVWCGLDFGTKKSVYVIKFHPRANQLGRMLGGKFQVSSTADFSSDVETLYSVDSTPSLQWYTVVAKMATTYQYARYLSPNGGWGNIAEVEFWGL